MKLFLRGLFLPWAAWFSLVAPGDVQGATEPTALWLRLHGLQPWELALDHDGDGFSSGAEFQLGTDPWDPESRPLTVRRLPDAVSVVLPNPPGVSYELWESEDLTQWFEVPDLPAPDGQPVELRYELDTLRRFFQLVGLGLVDSDGDGLLDFEEITLIGSDPFVADTDGDGWSDGEEVLVRGTDPLRAPSGGVGTLRGRVVLDEDRDPDTRSHPGLEGWTVFLDLDGDGEVGLFEPVTTTAADGSYVFEFLEPGVYRVQVVRQPAWIQIFPSPVPLTTPDGYPDRVVSYTDSGLGPIAGPYGKNPDPLPGARLVSASTPEPVDPGVVLGALPLPPWSAPVGVYTHVDFLSLPQDAELVVAFDGEEIVDGPGPDLMLITEGRGGEQAEVYLGSTPDNLTLAGVFTEAPSIPIDLADYDVPRPVRYVKLRALDLLGSFPGFDLFGFEALNYQPINRDYYEVILGPGETVEDLDFGMASDDRPPKVFLRPDRLDVRAGDLLPVRVIASDDRGIATTVLLSNGAGVDLDEAGQGEVPVLSGGLLELVAIATDHAGQSATTLLTIVARYPDGSLPDLSGLGVSGAANEVGPVIRVTSPAVGEIVTQSTPVVASITGPVQPVTSWRLEHAPVELVNPEALDFDDPDYLLLAEGSGPVVNAVVATLPIEEWTAGAHFLRFSATDLQGTTAYQGFVLGVNVDPLDIRPEIVLESPEDETQITYLTDLTGSIRTRDELREWYVEVAPLSEVDLLNLNAPGVTWIRIGSGNDPVESGMLARVDPTVLPNDSYLLRVSAWNRNGLGWAEPRVVQVTGEGKLGHFRKEFLDLELPLAGIPIQVRRVYDSLNASRAGDFGYGWSLAIQEADLRETVPQTGTGFRSTPLRVGSRVYLNAPDGRRVGFTFQPEVGLHSLLGSAWRAVFVPDPGVDYRLSVPEEDQAFLQIAPATGEAFLFFLGFPWNPDVYRLTDRGGVRYTYDQHEGLIEIADLAGNTVTFSATAIQHSGGLAVRLERDAEGRITSMTDPEGRQWVYEYDAAGDLVRVVYPGGFEAALGYASDRAHFLETINDPVGQPALTIEYDEEGRVAAIVDALGNRREQSWDPDAFTGTVTDARGHVTELIYDARGNVIRRVDPLGSVMTYEYGDPRHPDRETTFTNPNGTRLTLAYDERGNLLSVIGPVITRTSIRYTYDDWNNVTAIQYGSGGSERFVFNERNQMTGTQLGLGNVSFTYNTGGGVASVLDGVGAQTRFEYDSAASGPSRILSAEGGAVELDYDAAGLVTRVRDALGSTTTLEVDVAGRPVRLVHPGGDEYGIRYHPEFPQAPEVITNCCEGVVRFDYDAAGRLVLREAPGGAVTRFEYDADGNRTAVVDPMANRREFAYDALDRIVTETDENGHRRTHRYDAAGNRTETVDRRGYKRTFVYDEMSRRTEERWHHPHDDSVLRTIRFTYNRSSTLNRVEDADAVLAFGVGATPGMPMANVRATYPGRAESLLGYAYDAAGRRSQWSLFNATVVRMVRDRDGRLRIFTVEGQDTNRGRLEFWLNPRGDVSEIRRFADVAGTVGAGTTRFAEIDPRGWVNRIEHRDPAGDLLPEGIQVLTRSAGGRVDGMEEGSTDLAYGYDSANQLVEVTRNGSITESYAYDAGGNRTASHLLGGHAVDTGNRLTQAGSWTLDYDPEGNLITQSNASTGTTLRFTWDHRQRLTQVEQELEGVPSRVLVEYLYDPLDRRIAEIRDGQIRWTYYDGDHPIADYLNDETTPDALYYHGEGTDELLAIWRRGEGLFWVLTDHLDSVRRLLDQDGVEVARFDYDAFGNPLSATGSRPELAGRFGYGGREWDAETGLLYLRARYYDPELGRFLSEDPIGFDGGDFNLYRYALNRPMHLKDPSGTVTAVEYAVLEIAEKAADLGFYCSLAFNVTALYVNIIRNVVPALQGRPAPSGFAEDGTPEAVKAIKPSLTQPGFYHPILNLPGCAKFANDTLAGG